MTKFRVGDRVKCPNDVIGEKEGIIVKIKKDMLPYLVEIEVYGAKYFVWFREKDLKLISEVVVFT